MRATSVCAQIPREVSERAIYYYANHTSKPRLQEMAVRYNTAEVIDLLDEPVDMEDEPCLEGSEDDLELTLSDDEERLVHTSKIITTHKRK